MAQQGVTQNELARRTGIAQPSLSVILSGGRDCRWSTLERILRALGLSNGSTMPQDPFLDPHPANGSSQEPTPQNESPR